MSLYRQARSRRAALLPFVAVALASLVLGVLLGRLTKSTPTLSDQVTDVRDRTQEAIAGFELERTHYARDRSAGQAQAERAAAVFGDVESDLASLRPAETRAAKAAVAAAVEAAERGASNAEVDAAARRAEAALHRAAGR